MGYALAASMLISFALIFAGAYREHRKTLDAGFGLFLLTNTAGALWIITR